MILTALAILRYYADVAVNCVIARRLHNSRSMDKQPGN